MVLIIVHSENLLTGRSQQVVMDGEYSVPTTVISRVPQGSLYLACYYSCYINDISQNLTSTIRDDTLIHRTISNEEGVIALQNDINTIIKWSIDWQISFNPKSQSF